MALTLAEANRIIAGTIAKAEELNIKVNVAVCDAGGRLVAFNRMDGAIWAGVYGSQGKAVAAAGFGRTSGELQERADQPTPRGIAAAEGGHMIMGQGAVPSSATASWTALAAWAEAPANRTKTAPGPVWRPCNPTHICRRIGEAVRAPGQPLRPENPSHPGAAKSR